MSDKDYLSLCLIKARKKTGLSQSDFAHELGLSRTAVYLYESGKRIVGTETLLKIWEKYGIEPNEVLGIVKD